MDLRFGDFLLSPATRELSGPEGPLELSARSFDILALLLGRPDDVVRKAEIFDAVWPGLVVEENTLQVHISALRKLLGAGWITTVHGRGYKYSGPRPMPATDPAGPDGVTGPGDGDGPRYMLDKTGGKTVPVTGGCLCGEIRFRVTGTPLDIVVCHCRMCQKFSGAPFSVGSIYPAAAVTFAKGEPKYFRSSPFAERGFCASCGSSLVFRPVAPAVSQEWDDWVLVEIGTFDNPALHVPKWELGIESQLPWLDLKLGHKRVRCQDSPDIVEAWAASGMAVP